MSAKDLPIQERRKLYNALQRRMNNPVGLKPGLVEKYLACKGQDKKRFDMLKEFLTDPDMNLIGIFIVRTDSIGFVQNLCISVLIICCTGTHMICHKFAP